LLSRTPPAEPTVTKKACERSLERAKEGPIAEIEQFDRGSQRK
jgi:hypothetical protein